MNHYLPPCEVSKPCLPFASLGEGLLFILCHMLTRAIRECEWHKSRAKNRYLQRFSLPDLHSSSRASQQLLQSHGNHRVKPNIWNSKNHYATNALKKLKWNGNFSLLQFCFPLQGRKFLNNVTIQTHLWSSNGI